MELTRQLMQRMKQLGADRRNVTLTVISNGEFGWSTR